MSAHPSIFSAIDAAAESIIGPEARGMGAHWQLQVMTDRHARLVRTLACERGDKSAALPGWEWKNRGWMGQSLGAAMWSKRGAYIIRENAWWKLSRSGHPDASFGTALEAMEAEAGAGGAA